MCQKEKAAVMFREVIIPRILAERKADRLACGRPVDGELDLRYDRFGLVLDGELGTLLAAFSMIHEFVDIGVVLAKICSSSSGAATAGQHADKMQTFLLAHAGIRAATKRRSRLTAVNKLLENDNQVISMCLGEDETWKTSHFARSVRSQLRTAGVRPPPTFSVVLRALHDLVTEVLPAATASHIVQGGWDYYQSEATALTQCLGFKRCDEAGQQALLGATSWIVDSLTSVGHVPESLLRERLPAEADDYGQGENPDKEGVPPWCERAMILTVPETQERERVRVAAREKVVADAAAKRAEKAAAAAKKKIAAAAAAAAAATAATARKVAVAHAAWLVLETGQQVARRWIRVQCVIESLDAKDKQKSACVAAMRYLREPHKLKFGASDKAASLATVAAAVRAKQDALPPLAEEPQRPPVAAPLPEAPPLPEPMALDAPPEEARAVPPEEGRAVPMEAEEELEQEAEEVEEEEELDDEEQQRRDSVAYRNEADERFTALMWDDDGSPMWDDDGSPMMEVEEDSELLEMLAMQNSDEESDDES